MLSMTTIFKNNFIKNSYVVHTFAELYNNNSNT